MEHEREKTIAQQQNLSESASSIYHCFDGHIRYSGSEPINTNLNALENQFDAKCNKETGERESKASVNQIPFTNNFERSSTKENDMNSITSASIIKDNQVNMSGCSLNNSQTNKKQSKKKMLASSDSDFFSLLRYNSEKLRRINCFSISTNNGNKPKNMIYALSDSDFLIGVNDKNKNLNLNNERKSQAIVNKSDIFNFLINQKSFDCKNLLDNNLAQNNHHQKIKSSDLDYNKKHFDNPDLFNMEKLKAVFGEGSDNAKIIESISLNGDISEVEKIQKKETVSLPPNVNANNDFHNVMLNNSQSIDTVLLNMKNSAGKLSSDKLSYDFSKSTLKNLNDDASIVNNVMSESLRKLADSTTNPSVQDNSTDDNNRNYTKCCDVMNPVALDDKSITRRKRTPSTVTYNVNVINFQADDEADTISGGYGKRSNSSTSECFAFSLMFTQAILSEA